MLGSACENCCRAGIDSLSGVGAREGNRAAGHYASMVCGSAGQAVGGGGGGRQAL